MQRSLTNLERLAWRRGWRWSGWLHLFLICGLCLQLLWLPWPNMPGGEAVLIARVAPPEEAMEITVEMTAETRPWLEVEAERLDFIPVDVDDPAWQAILNEPNQPHEREQRADVLLASAIEQAIAETSRRSEEANLQDLEKLGSKLTQVSSEQGVAEVNGTIGRMLGANERATAPQAAVGGAFEFTSAQVHDVRKETLPDGTIRYWATMIDAAGRTMEVELDAANGETSYRTMQLVKSNPLLERVYRGVVMGLIDKVLQTK